MPILSNIKANIQVLCESIDEETEAEVAEFSQKIQNEVTDAIRLVANRYKTDDRDMRERSTPICQRVVTDEEAEALMSPTPVFLDS